MSNLNTSDNPIASISNNLGFDVDIYDVYNSTGDPNGLYTYTKLGTVKANAQLVQIQTIHRASQLQAMRTGTVDALNEQYYYQFPVKVMAVSMLKDDNTFIITTDDQEGMEQSFMFIKYVTANLDSKTAKAFITALSDADNQEAAVNAFFAGTGSFKKCTLITWVAVTAWQVQFSSAWQGNYYLYSVVDGPVTATNKPELIATVSIVSTKDQQSATLKLSGQSDLSTSLSMVGDGTIQESNPGDDTLSVSLTPTWLNVRQRNDSSGKPVKFVLGSALAGTVGGVKVAGTQQKLDLPDGNSSSSSSMRKFQLAQGIINSTFQLTGILLSIAMFAIMTVQLIREIWWKKNNVVNKADGNSPQFKQDVEKEQIALDNDLKEEMSGNEMQAIKTAANDAASTSGSVYGQLNNSEMTSELSGAIQKEEGKIENLLERGPASPALEQTEGELNQAEIYLDADDPAKGKEVVGKVEKDIDGMLKRNKSKLQQQEKEVLENAENTLSEETEEIEAVEAAEEALPTWQGKYWGR
ncbi:hypothetical protein [uncultured Chitinophaga sp.]|jgi:Thiol:disulfide interchange protein|uniref:hypothetical protein n=1 Tax=uncultured Chitinophaga sp. TaxID=339340 RepID=UPI0026246703|nr:hypothetical protein [uncultured Chitinophaga sp.]